MPSSDFTSANPAALAAPVLLLGAIVGFALLGAMLWRRSRDLTVLRQERENLQQSRAALQEELDLASSALEVATARRQEVEALLEATLEKTPTVLLATDSDGRLTLAEGQPLWALTGRGRNELLHESIVDVLPDLTEAVRKALAGEAILAETRANGRVLRFHLEPGHATSSQNADLGVLGIGFDVTAMDLTEQHLGMATQAAESASAAANRFLANMSHEIRTPVAGILGLSELLMLETDLPATARECVVRIASSANRLSSLIGTVLDFSKIEAQAVTLEEVDFQPSEVLRDLRVALEPRARAKGLELRIESDDEMPALNGDPIRLLQVLTNLVENAIRFTSEGSIAVRLTQVPTRGAGKVGIEGTVTDTGVGISPQNQARLFEPLLTPGEAEAASQEASGLGLGISKRLVELMGGTIGVESTVGKGSTFRFTALFSPSRHFQTTGDLEDSATDPIIHSSRVLIVEDDDVNRLILVKMLESLGCRPVGVEDGVEALATLHKQRYDLVLMDCQLPRLDGFETTRTFRHQESTSDRTPVVALTAGNRNGQREKCLAAGMNDFLTKPVSQTELRRTLERWLGPERPPEPSTSARE